MKRYCILALALVLGCSIFTGCRRGGNMVTVPPTTQAATERPTMATVPPTRPTEPAVTEPSTAVSPTDSTTDATGETGGNSQARKAMPNMR